jgi:homocysteine S-methyltransferase
MADPIAQALKDRPFLVLDGALATELERRGADLLDPLWSAKTLLEHPQMIHAVHLDYFRAGADIAITATYQASFEGFRRRGLAPAAAAQALHKAVALAAAAREVFWGEPSNRTHRLPPLIAASVGPFGAMLADGSEYRGGYAASDRELADFHRPRLEVLAHAGADLIACETLPCMREALVLARLLSEFPALSAWMSFSCRDGAHNSEGEEIADCARELEDCAQVAAIGINCTAPQYVDELLGRMSERTGKPLLAYPNSGQAYDPASKCWSGARSSPSLARGAPSWYAAGARLMGGCCRTTPADIRAVSEYRSTLMRD